VTSFKKGSEAVKKFLDLEITPKGLRNVTEKMGRERASLRDAEVRRFQKGELASQYPQAAAVAAVMLDGGRAQIRASNSPPGVHDAAWTETKVGNLATYTNLNFRSDPQPEDGLRALSKGGATREQCTRRIAHQGGQPAGERH